jgi:hypothetical protein
MDELFKKATKAIAAKFSIEDVADVDPVTHNASRLIKLFGTMARKGADTAQTPHRFSHLGGVPKNLRVVTQEQLEAIASTLAESKRGLRTAGAKNSADKVAEFLDEGGVDIKDVKDLQGGGKQWVLRACVFNPEHKDAAVFLYPDGGLAYLCFHKSCGHNKNRWSEFQKAIEEKTGKPFQYATSTAVIPYEATPNGIVYHTYTTRGEKVTKALTNFTARITTSIEEDDGVETRHSMEIEARLNGRERQVHVPASDFANLNRVIEKLGAEAIIFPGAGLRDHARVAIQCLSGTIPTRQVFTHTGWRHLEDNWVYLHGGGAIGAHGLNESISVRLSGCLAPFVLPEPPIGEKLKAAIRASLQLLGVAPLSCTAPIYASIWRAALGAADFSLHASGPTGTFKTSYCALAMQHYGAGFDYRHVPGTWSSTANSNAQLQFVSKDALLLIDDFVPRGSSADVERYHKDAERIFRGQGNNSGRGRLGRNGSSLREANPPRGLTLSTGEDVPRGQSVTSRFLHVEFAPGDMNLEKLTACQADAGAGVYAEAMSAFLQWLAPQYSEVKKELPNKIREWRDKAGRSGQHPRTPEIIAHLIVGLNHFFRFAKSIGALSHDDAVAIRDRVWRVCSLLLLHRQLGRLRKTQRGGS